MKSITVAVCLVLCLSVVGCSECPPDGYEIITNGKKFKWVVKETGFHALLPEASYNAAVRSAWEREEFRQEQEAIWVVVPKKKGCE